mmetsp:Transcript_7692/g.21405  ORF Transcript_7692/g.21405 Transcript_7692/m.21405 type:complete len:213 (-) Transcript_7692:828-1466(-)
MGGPRFTPSTVVWGVVKIVISQQVLGRIRTGFEEPFSCLSKLQVVFTNILQPALATKVSSRLVRLHDIQNTSHSIKVSGRRPTTILGNVGPSGKICSPSPNTRVVWCKVSKPTAPRCAARIGGIAVSRVIAWYCVGDARSMVGEFHIQTVVCKRVGCGCLTGGWSGESKRDLVPLFFFTIHNSLEGVLIRLHIRVYGRNGNGCQTGLSTHGG